MLLIVITPAEDVDNELDIVGALFASGLQLLHLRKPGYSIGQYRNYISSIDPSYHARIVVHDHFALFAEFGLSGIHLNSTMKADKQVWFDISPIALSSVSTSFHSWDELQGNDVPYRYIFISPVFDSISKQGYKAGVDLAGAKQLKLQYPLKDKFLPQIVALGGVGKNEIRLLKETGFDGAAMLGYVWQSADPVQSFKDALAATL